MKYILMHKDIPVAKLSLDDVLCDIWKIEDVYCAEHLPVGVSLRRGRVDRGELNVWWIDRSIPMDRSGVRRTLEILNLQSTKMLLTKCLGLSLSDQYWIRPVDCPNMQWKDVNFFNNPFSEDVGDLLLGKAPSGTPLNLHTPDNTTDGYLKKRWKIINGKRCLIKGGSAPLMLQTFHEVIVSSIAEKMGISHIPYKMFWDDGIPYCVCESFIDENTEFVSAWRIMQTCKKSNDTSVYQHFLNCCNHLGIPKIKENVDQMIVLDYIVGNEDRHFNNFGAIRNATTLEWIGFAPIFDSGSCLGYDKLPAQIISGAGMVCKPFKSKHEAQLRLVSSFEWIDFDTLSHIWDIVAGVFENAGAYADQCRIQAVTIAIKKRIDMLKRIAQNGKDRADRIEEDVPENVAATYN